MSILAFSFSYEQILPFILAILLIFLIPMLMRRYGLNGDDLIRMVMTRLGKQDYAAQSKELRDKQKRNKKEPYQSNGRSGDLKSFLSTLLIFVRRNKLGLVYPGTVRSGNKTAGLLALLVTNHEVIGFNCFGYGGTITEGNDKGSWNQHMNGVDKPFESPVKGNAAQYEIVRRLMDEDGMKDIPLRVLAVFTSRDVTLNIRSKREVYTVETLISYLKELAAEEEKTINPEEISLNLNKHVERIKRKK